MSNDVESGIEWYEDEFPRAAFTARLTADHLEALLGGLSGVRILDLGCSSGYISRELARRGAECLGIEGHAELVEWGAHHRPMGRVRLVVGNVRDAKAIAASFNWRPSVTIANGILYHLGNPLTVLREWADIAPTLYLDTESAPPSDDAPVVALHRLSALQDGEEMGFAYRYRTYHDPVGLPRASIDDAETRWVRQADLCNFLLSRCGFPLVGVLEWDKRFYQEYRTRIIASRGSAPTNA